MYILIKNQEGESMNLLSQNTDFNALLAAMKTDIEAEYEKATGYAIDLDEDALSQADELLDTSLLKNWTVLLFLIARPTKKCGY